MMRGTKLIVAWALVAAIPAGLAAQVSRGIITGRVIDRATQQPIAGANVVVAGTTLGVQTSENGAFRIGGVGAGTVQIRVLRIGYQSQTKPVTVVAGQTATVDFELASSAVQLDVQVVTATGQEQRAREQGSNVAKVTVDSQPLAAINNMSSLLQARTAGVTVVQSGGTTGTGARVRIRGANSVSLSNEPLLIIDGIRANNDAGSSSIGVGGQSPSRLNDLKPEDIESIEILKGPAATGLYGTQAANGVIQVTTKRGQQGKTRYEAFAEGGLLNDENTYPANYVSFYHTAAGAAGFAQGGCRLRNMAAGTCTIDSVHSQNLVSGPYSMLQQGNRRQFGASISGGNNVATYYLSADQQTEDGVYDVNNLGKRNYRLNLDATPSQKLRLSSSFTYLNSKLEQIQNDNNVYGLLSTALLGKAVDCSPKFPCGSDTLSHGYYNSGIDPLTLKSLAVYQVNNRSIGSVNANYRPLSWLSINATTGLDFNDRDDQQLLPPNTFLLNTSTTEGNRVRNRIDLTSYTANGSATATHAITSSLNSTTTAGVQFNKDVFSGTYASGARLLAGTSSLAGTSARYSVSESNQDSRLFGVLAQEQLAWRDRVFLTGGVRGDKSSAFGQDLGFITYPSAQASWVISEEPFFPKPAFLSSLRLRTAVGTSGLRPGVLDALLYYNPVAAATAAGDVPAFAVGGAGNPGLKPERTTEAEGGFDLAMFNNRATFEVTYYAKRSRDALISRTLAPSLGGPSSRFENIGTVANKGLEVSTNLNLVDTRNFGLSAAINYSTLANKLVSLAPGITPIIYGLGGATERHTPGYPLGSFFQPTFTYADANGNGIIETSEVKVDTAFSYLGNPLPKQSLTIQPQVTLFRNLKLQATIDGRYGFYLFNDTHQFECVTVVNCPEIYVKGSPLYAQAAAIAGTATSAGYIEDASFTKLREIALSYGLPNAWAARLGAKGLNLSLAARNLKTWTKYSGPDPEVSEAGQSNWTFADFLTQPPVRYVVARVNVQF